MTHPTDSLTGLLENQRRGSECPAPEQFLADEWAALAPRMQQQIDAHVAGCAMCQSEREMANAFVDATGADDVERKRVERVQAVVDERVQRPVPPAQRHTGAYIAMAAVVVLGIAVMFAALGPRWGQPPAPVMRGANLVLVAPLSEQATPVQQFAWHPVQAAASYTVTVNDPSGATVYTSPSQATMLTLPSTESDWQRPGTTYHWRVDAYDRAGVLVGTSGDGRFRLSPAAENES